jgi:hypothetical protein
MAEKMKVLAPDVTGKLSETVGDNMGGMSIQWIEPNTDEYLDEAAFSKRFSELYIKWREETRFDSFIGDPYHKSYNKIVQLGNRVIPCIINKLKEEPSLIFTALIRITRENPIKEENRGIVREMAKDWIDWWEKKNNAVGCSDA